MQTVQESPRGTLGALICPPQGLVEVEFGIRKYKEMPQEVHSVPCNGFLVRKHCFIDSKEFLILPFSLIFKISVFVLDVHVKERNIYASLVCFLPCKPKMYRIHQEVHSQTCARVRKNQEQQKLTDLTACRTERS